MTRQPLPLTAQIAQESFKPQPRKTCPLCHRPVTFTIVNGRVVLDRHRAYNNETMLYEPCEPKQK